MSNITAFRGQVSRADVTGGGINRTEFEEIKAAYDRFAGEQRAAADTWLQTNAPQLASVLGQAGSYDNFTGRRAFERDRNAPYSPEVARYFPVLERLDVPLDLRSTSAGIDGPALQAALDAIGPESAEHFIETVIMGDSGLNFALGEEAAVVLARAMGRSGADGVEQLAGVFNEAMMAHVGDRIRAAHQEGVGARQDSFVRDLHAQYPAAFTRAPDGDAIMLAAPGSRTPFVIWEQQPDGRFARMPGGSEVLSPEQFAARVADTARQVDSIRGQQSSQVGGRTEAAEGPAARAPTLAQVRERLGDLLSPSGNVAVEQGPNGDTRFTVLGDTPTDRTFFRMGADGSVEQVGGRRPLRFADLDTFVAHLRR